MLQYKSQYFDHEDMIDHRSYAHNLSSCEIKKNTKAETDTT